MLRFNDCYTYSIVWCIFVLSITIKAKYMYYQIFLKSKRTGKESQFSCDSINEVRELLEERKPKFIRIQYFNSFGLIGTGFQYLSFKTGMYESYKKIKA